MHLFWFLLLSLTGTMVNAKAFSNAIKSIKTNANRYLHHSIGSNDYPEEEEEPVKVGIKETVEEISPDKLSEFEVVQSESEEVEEEEEVKKDEEKKESKKETELDVDDDNSKEDDDKPKEDSGITPDTVESTGKTFFLFFFIFFFYFVFFKWRS